MHVRSNGSSDAVSALLHRRPVVVFIGTRENPFAVRGLRAYGASYRVDSIQVKKVAWVSTLG